MSEKVIVKLEKALGHTIKEVSEATKKKPPYHLNKSQTTLGITQSQP
jgi:hypothetical protein